MNQVIKDLVANISKYLNLDSEEVTPNNELLKYTIPSFINKNTIDVEKTLQEKGLTYIKVGDGEKIIKQYPQKDNVVTSLDKIVIVTNSENITMPNLMGYSNSEVKNILNIIGVPYEIEGTGYVTSQSIAAGAIITKNDLIHIVLGKKY